MIIFLFLHLTSLVTITAYTLTIASAMLNYLLLLFFRHPVMSDSLQPRGLQLARPPCSSPSPGVCPSSCPLHQWCHPAISSSDTLFSFCPQSFPASGSFSLSCFFTSGGQNTGASVSVSVLPVSIQGWFPLRLAGLISSQSKGLSKVFSSTTVRKHEYSYFSLFPKLLHWLYATF